MKAISLWQPFASLVAIGVKHYETRSWPTPYRGPLVICAAKKWDWETKEYAEEFSVELESAGLNWQELPLGKALCIVQLVECHRTEAVLRHIDDDEECYGDYSRGRYAWELATVRRFRQPIPIRGAQGLFDVTVPLDQLEPVERPDGQEAGE